MPKKEETKPELKKTTTKKKKEETKTAKKPSPKKETVQKKTKETKPEVKKVTAKKKKEETKKASKKPSPKKETVQKKTKETKSKAKKETEEEKEEEVYKVKKKPKISKEKKERIKIRKRIKSRKPEFLREEWFRYKRIPHNWRRPDGITSKMRINKKYRPSKVRVGFRGPKDTRGLHSSGFEEVMVFNPNDLKNINPKIQAARIGGSVGTKKRLEIEKKAEELDIRILNI